MYTVADLMTHELVTLKEDDDLSLADTIIYLGRIRHLPVVDKAGKLVGLVTHRDLLRAYAARGEGLAKVLPAREIMTTKLSRVTPRTPLQKALRLMLKNKYGCLPVVTPGGKLVGILTESDLVRFTLSIIGELDRLQRAGLESIGV